ncbi:lipase chaperone [Vibrio profundum]|uniref:lipase secretion chaperone n=1 Tax=Vibrio profundum TaxID=2910247 RepID=UPI003D0D2E38
MRKAALSVLLIIGVTGAALLYRHSTSEKQSLPKLTQAHSQQDTHVDTSSVRDTFEYFLTELGEADLNTIKQRFDTFNHNAHNQDELDLFKRYIAYRSALQSINSKHLDMLDVHAWQQIDEQLIQLQLKFFSPQEQQQLFAEENQLRSLALKRLELKQQADSNDDFQQLWQQELNELPPELQESYRNASLLSQLQLTDSLDDQQRYLKQEQLVGAGAAIRLAALKDERTEFQHDLDNYFKQRQSIRSEKTSTIEEQVQAINELRRTTFSANQLRRVKALESIHDKV